MLKTIAYVCIILAFALVIFFGLGPVLLADGGMAERITTLVVVIVLLGILTILFRMIQKMKK